MSATRHWIFVLSVAVLSCACEDGDAQPAKARAPYVPEPKPVVSWAREVVDQQRQLANQACRVCFIGDSLTQFWAHHGNATWESHFAPLKSANLGLAADRTEHVLNRIQRLEFRRANPRLIVLMMGTNNLGMDPPDKPEDVARAVKDGVELLHTKLPQASILVLTMPPNGYEPDSIANQRINQTNALLMQHSWPAHARVLQIHDAMVDDRGRWRAGFTLDGTHFTEAGYAKLGEVIAPVVKDMLGQEGLSDR
jgi:lysophospholipase L1-like esterase